MDGYFPGKGSARRRVLSVAAPEATTPAAGKGPARRRELSVHLSGGVSRSSEILCYGVRWCGAGPHDSNEIQQEVFPMNMNIALQPLLALIAGILILIMPRLLNYVVAIYLIVVGVMGLLKL
ncbi:DUF3096 domain-containing protein [Oceanidesulfovibrio indonesiensis]|nr:DUF3096 domain-containing protein [Oceanidesulfovibrio indonesiensis]